MGIDELCRAVKTPTDLKSLPGYTNRVDPAATELRRVIWPYTFPFEIQCSLTNCGARHRSGVIIELEDGTVSNIGHICGADPDKFSTKFSQEMARMKEGRLRETMMPVLLDRATLQTIERDVRSAYSSAQRWLTWKSAFSEMFPEAAQEVGRRIASGVSMAISETIERTEKEIDEIVAAGLAQSRSSARYYEVRKGVIEGSKVWTLFEGDLERMWRRTDALLAADPQAASISKLHALFTDVHQLPNEVRSVVEACEAGKLFFSTSNLSLLAELPMSASAKRRLESLTPGQIEAYIFAKKPGGGTPAVPRKLTKKQRDHYRRAGLKPPEY